MKTDIFYHFPIIFSTKNKIDTEIPEECILKHNISDQSIDKFKQKLRNIDWSNIKILQNDNDGYSKFLEIFLSLIVFQKSKLNEKHKDNLILGQQRA